jgi:hypothetical protein
VADQKISALTELAAAPATDDELIVVDKSDTSMAATGTDKRIQASNLVPVNAAAGTASLRSLSTTSTTAAPGDLAYTAAGNQYQVLSAASLVLHDQAAATLGLVHGGLAAVNPAFNTSAAAPTPVGCVPIFRYVTTDHAVTSAGSGLTTSMFIRSQVACVGANSGINFTFGLYPVTLTATVADVITFTLGTVVSGTTSAHSNPVNGAINLNQSTPQASVASGTYCLGCVTSGTLNNNASVQLSAQLYVSNA